MEYDVIVVGGGPAGLMAARTAAEDGLKVLLIERKKEVTEVKRLCGQLTNISFINVSGRLKYGTPNHFIWRLAPIKPGSIFPR